MAVRKDKITPPPAKPYETTVGTTCDICGHTVDYDAAGDHHEGDRHGWTRDSYDIAAVVMKHQTGSSYPEGTTVESSIFDVCPKCWEKVIVPFMATHGAKPREEEIDY